jgi:DNA-binding beta-propeller fold protein YncE
MTWFCVFAVAAVAACTLIGAELQSGPPLPHRLVNDWAKLPPGQSFGECPGIALDGDDNVWVFERPRTLLKFNRDGKLLSIQEIAEAAIAHGVRIDSNGNFWFTDNMGHVVIRFRGTAAVERIYGTKGQPGANDSKTSFNQPTNVAFAPDGGFFVSDGYGNSRVVRFGRDGSQVAHWGRKGAGDGEFSTVHDVCLDGHGRLYVADRDNARIQIFDADGKFLGKWTGIGSPWGLAYVAREQAIYMADGVNNRVVKLNMEGRVVGVLGRSGKGPGEFDLAHGIAVDSTGAIYVSEIRNRRVQKFAIR